MIRKVLGASCALVMLAVAVALVPQRGKAADVDQVLVVNGPKKPVPVTLAPGGIVGIAPGSVIGVRNRDALQAVQRNVVLNIDNGSFGADGTYFTVDPGKRFVLEDVSGAISLPTGQKLLSAGLKSFAGGPIFAPITFAGPFGAATDEFRFGRAGRAYVDQGDTVVAFVVRNSNVGTGVGTMAIAGYLVDL